MNSSVHTDNQTKDILIFGVGPTGVLSFHCNRENSYIFVNGVEIQKFKAKDSEVNAGPLCLGNVSKDFSADNLKTTGLYGHVYHSLSWLY